MNIFILNKNIYSSAASHINSHVCKMPTELGQICSTVVRKINPDEDSVWKSTHPNHPCTIWAGLCRDNFIYAIETGIALCHEYSIRYKKRHAALEIINNAAQYIRQIPNEKIPKIYIGYWPVTEPPQAMPDKFKDSDVITAYRNYYIGDKIYRSDGRVMMVYTNRLPPDWLMDVFQFSYNEKFNQYKVNLQKAESVL